jgi:hypothetical protein
MLTQFNNEVLLKGPDAVLPQNLTTGWLKKLQDVSENFLEQNFSLDECKQPQDVTDPLLSVCVLAILRYQKKDPAKIPIEKMLEYITVYAISILMEGVNREGDIGLDPPDLNNILSVDRIVDFKKVNPEFYETLKQACVIREAASGWFDNIKKKILSKIKGT